MGNPLQGSLPISILLQAAWKNRDLDYPKDWPNRGNIRFQEYSTRYRPGLELILKKISCDVKPKEKVLYDFFTAVTCEFLKQSAS